MNQALARAIKHFGSEAALARELKVSRQTVNQWVRGVRAIPYTRCIEIEISTDGKARRERLRPDRRWKVLSTPRVG